MPYAPGLPDPQHQPELYAGTAVKRAIAWVIDTALIVVACTVIVTLTAFVGLLVLPILWFALNFVYRVITLSSPASATYGMRLMALELRSLDGQKFDSRLAVLHTLGFTISFALPIVQIASALLMMTHERGQGLTDLLLGTTAVNAAR